MMDLAKKTMLMAILVATGTLALDNDVGLTPPMGWSSKQYPSGVTVTQDLVKSAADYLTYYGMSDLGYQYVNVDDYWATKQRDSNGHIIRDVTKFHDDMSMLSKYVHDKGLKFGIFSSAGSQTCGGQAGSLLYEQLDAADYALWKVDYLKYENCNGLGIPALDRFSTMRDALLKTNRDIFFAMSTQGQEDVLKWGPSVGNSWTTTVPTENTWMSIKNNFYFNDQSNQAAGPGGWNDPGELQIGRTVLTYAQERTHFALWCIAKAPLIFGGDLQHMPYSSKSILMNKYLIQVNQDSYGKQGTCVQNCFGDVRVYGAQQIDDGGYWAVVAVNWNDHNSLSVGIDFIILGATNSPVKKCSVYDLWDGSFLGTFQGLITVPQIAPHDNRALRIKCTVASENPFSGEYVADKENF